MVDERAEAAAPAGQRHTMELEPHRFPNWEDVELREREEVEVNDVVEDLDFEPTDITAMLESLWQSIDGRDQPAVVAHMNYSYGDVDNPVLTCEMGFAVFTVRQGVFSTYSTHLMCDVESAAQPEVCGSCGDGDVCKLAPSVIRRNGTWILMNMEQFLQRHRPPGFRHTPIFCSKGLVPTVESRLLGLYEKAGQSFHHDVIPLEWLMIALSKCGQLNLATEESMEADDLLKFIESTISTHRAKEDEGSQLTIKDLSEPCRSRFNTIDPEGYWKLGRADRIAATHFDFFPGPALGVFLSERDAEMYLAINWKAYGSLLACRDHDVKEHGNDVDKSVFCALSVAKRHAFLILDALLVNFGFSLTPVACLHYPRSN